MPPYNNTNPNPEMERLIGYRREFKDISEKYIKKSIPDLPLPCLHDDLENFGLDIWTIKALFLDEDRRTVALESLHRAIIHEYSPDRLGFEEILVRAVFGPKTSVRDAFGMMERELGIGSGPHQRGGIEGTREDNKDWLYDWENGRLSSYAKGSLLCSSALIIQIWVNSSAEYQWDGFRCQRALQLQGALHEH